MLKFATVGKSPFYKSLYRVACPNFNTMPIMFVHHASKKYHFAKAETISKPTVHSYLLQNYFVQNLGQGRVSEVRSGCPKLGHATLNGRQSVGRTGKWCIQNVEPIKAENNPILYRNLHNIYIKTIQPNSCKREVILQLMVRNFIKYYYENYSTYARFCKDFVF